jgi:hypothetical protein
MTSGKKIFHHRKQATFADLKGQLRRQALNRLASFLRFFFVLQAPFFPPVQLSRDPTPKPENSRHFERVSSVQGMRALGLNGGGHESMGGGHASIAGGGGGGGGWRDSVSDLLDVGETIGHEDIYIQAVCGHI